MKSKSAFRKLSTVIDHLEQNQRLVVPENFIERMKAIDVLELHMLDDIALLNDAQLTGTDRLSLAHRAGALKQKLADANDRLFAHLLRSIRANDRSTVKQYFMKAGQRSTDDDCLGYDEIDMLVNGLLEVPFVPAEAERRDADMFYYQPTPARIVLKLIEELHPASDDLFYDLGSGLGHVPILVNLLTEVKTKGIELEESYHRYSNECLEKLGLTNVEFIHADARDVDYSDGTIFYMYTPFQGETLQQVLRKLEVQSERQPIRVCTYGTCTLQVRKQRWLRPLYQTGKHEGSMGIFGSW